MGWTLSEFLDEMDLRQGTWCFVSMGAGSGFHLPHSSDIFFHFVLEGACKLTTGAGETLDCAAGDIAIVLSGEQHKIRNAHGRTAPVLDALIAGGSADSPGQVELGAGRVETRLLSGRLDMVWPIGNRPARIPSVILTDAEEVGIDIARYVGEARRGGGTALLNALAKLLFVRAFRDDRVCRAQVERALYDPLARAMVLLEIHPFKPWKVERLAAEVGMGRSNFASRFKDCFGMTPIEALNEQRMKHAASLLASTRLKVTEVSDRCGYRSEAAFIARFKAAFGMTPAQWRKARIAAGSR